MLYRGSSVYYKSNDVNLPAVMYDIVYILFMLDAYFRLSDLGQHVGVRIVDIMMLRERGYRREVKLLNMLLFVKNNLWKVLLLIILSTSFFPLLNKQSIK